VSSSRPPASPASAGSGTRADLALLDPVVLSAIHDLELVARATVEGALSGLHRSPFHGYSAEFQQYRHYNAGDDLKYVDWKLFARTDRVYTKQFRESTDVRVHLVLDASASMAHRAAAGISKIEYGRLLAAALAHLFVSQGDAAGLIVHDEDVRTYIGARRGRGHLRRLLAVLSRTTPGGRTASAHALRRAVDLMTSRGIIILISDLYDDEDGVDAALRRASRMGHEVVVLHVFTLDELDLAHRGPVEFVDAETGEVVLGGSSTARDYATNFSAFLERWRNRCASYNIDYWQVRTDLPPDRLLRAYLLQRARRPGR
jgi:uncharacterized protein (DUF58 family)